MTIKIFLSIISTIGTNTVNTGRKVIIRTMIKVIMKRNQVINMDTRNTINMTEIIMITITRKNMDIIGEREMKDLI